MHIYYLTLGQFISSTDRISIEDSGTGTEYLWTVLRDTDCIDIISFTYNLNKRNFPVFTQRSLESVTRLGAHAPKTFNNITYNSKTSLQITQT